MRSQVEKARAFQARHKQGSAFIIPNPWDIGTAQLLTLLGFEALATTSAAFALSRGQPDNSMGRDQTMAHLTDIASATTLPVSADLENGFGNTPDVVAETIRLAAATGIVGGSIEDSTNQHDDPIYAHDLAVERIRAASEAARALPFPFTLTARSENYFVGRPNLKDTIKRLQAYQEAGADVLFAPGLESKDDIAAVVGSVDRPVNVMMGFKGSQLSLKELSDIGVKRVSVGGSLALAALGAFLRAGQELRDHGTFTYVDTAAIVREMNKLFRGS